MSKRNREYQAYLKSAAWKAIRKTVIARDKKTCRKCGSKKYLVVHHTCYPEVLGMEDLDTLITLCEDCHNIMHGGSPRNSKKRRKWWSSSKKKKASVYETFTTVADIQAEIDRLTEQVNANPYKPGFLTVKRIAELTKEREVLRNAA